jgi:hypothetical protein
MANVLEELGKTGVAIWLDDLGRAQIVSGRLGQLLETGGVVGITTNPTIFAKARLRFWLRGAGTRSGTAGYRGRRGRSFANGMGCPRSLRHLAGDGGSHGGPGWPGFDRS